MVHDIRLAFMDLEYHLRKYTVRPEEVGGAPGSADVETQVHQFPHHRKDGVTVPIVHGDEYPAAGGQVGVDRRLYLGEGLPEGGADADGFPGGFHFRTENGIQPGEAVEGEDGFLDGPAGQASPFSDSVVAHQSLLRQ